MKVSNLLIIAGTGNKSGKTSMACKIIESFPELKITAIKITPHFHETTEGLAVFNEGNGYSIYTETCMESNKDTSRMLKAGAEKVFFSKVSDKTLFTAFRRIFKSIPAGTPFICESPALRNFVEPGAFIIMDSGTLHNKKDIRHLLILPHIKIKLEELDGLNLLPIGFEDGKWFMRQKVES